MIAMVAAIRSKSALLGAVSLLVPSCVPDYELHHRIDSGDGVRRDGPADGRAAADSSDRASFTSDGNAGRADGSDVSSKFDGSGGGGSGGSGGGTGGLDGSRDSIADPMGPDGATHRLLVSDDGIAFVSAPGLAKIAQAVTVVDSKGRPTEWDATSDQTWLQCGSCSGRAGDPIVLTVSATNLPADSVHYATVALSSRDPTVSHAETIRVGLWAGASRPQPSLSIPAAFVEIETDPIRPYAYAHNGGSSIAIYNIYTGLFVATIPLDGARLASMTISSDGSRLFVVDAAKRQIVPITLADKNVPYEIGIPWALDGTAPLFVEHGRSGGVSLLFTGDGRVRNAETGGVFASSFRARDTASVSKNGKRLCTLDAVASPYSFDCHSIDVDDGGNVVLGPGQNAAGNQGFGRDIALSPDGTRIYVAATGTNGFHVYEGGGTPQLTRALLGDYVPNNVEMSEDGRILTGADVPSGPADIWTFDANGANQLSFRVGRPLARQLRVSGDGLRLVALTAGSPSNPGSTTMPTLQFRTLASDERDAGVADNSVAPEAGDTDSGLPDAATDTQDDSADGGSGCGAVPSIVAVGTHQKASCGPFDVSDVLPGDGGVVYFVSIPLRRVVPWSAVTGACSSPIMLNISPKYVTYSSVNHRLYVAYTDGAITSIDPAAPTTEQPFAPATGEPMGLAAAGKWVVASSKPGAIQVFDPGGQEVASRGNFEAREFSWSGVNGYLYFIGAPAPFYLAQVECATGAIVGLDPSPYTGSYKVAPPIRVSPDGKTVFLGNSEIYDTASFQRRTSLPRIMKDATWLSNGKLLRLRASGIASLVEQRGPDLRVENVQAFEGTPVALRSIGDGAVVVTRVANQPTISIYHDNVDGDADGVPYAQDALPLDQDASVDTDHDGFPDAWNAAGDGGAGPLTLDAFPEDSACHLASQARTDDATRCDIPGTIPNYTPDSIVFDGTDILHLFSRADKRVFRYSTVQAKYLNPFVLQEDASLVAYVGAHGKLYLARDDGSLASIDITTAVEADFAALPLLPRGLAAVGNFVLAGTYDINNSWQGFQYIFGQDGSLISERTADTYSREYAFGAATSRVYFFRDETTPNDIFTARIDQVSGAVTDLRDSPYHGDFSIEGPIRVSQDGAYVLIGTGDLYDGIGLVRQRNLGLALLDAAWLPGNGLVVLTADGNLRWFDDTFTAGLVRPVMGVPVRVFWTAGKLVVVTMVDGKPSIELIAL